MWLSFKYPFCQRGDYIVQSLYSVLSVLYMYCMSEQLLSDWFMLLAHIVVVMWPGWPVLGPVPLATSLSTLLPCCHRPDRPHSLTPCYLCSLFIPRFLDGGSVSLLSILQGISNYQQFTCNNIEVTTFKLTLELCTKYKDKILKIKREIFWAFSAVKAAQDMQMSVNLSVSHSVSNSFSTSVLVFCFSPNEK